MADEANRDTGIARHYHEVTKHSGMSVMRSAHYLDFDNMPALFKQYRAELPKAKLPKDFPAGDVTVFNAFSREQTLQEQKKSFTLPLLAKLLYFTGGVTRVKYFGKKPYHFRAAACAGGLYPVEIYAACADCDGLSSGLYHFQPLEFSLARLRDGDFRNTIADAAGEPSFAASSAIFIFTAIPWRTAWKYQARGYRHCYWDSGMMAANLLSVASADEIPARMAAGFVDGKINRLLDVDGQREFALCLLALGQDEKKAADAVHEIQELRLEMQPLSPFEVQYRDIAIVHEASCLKGAQEVEAFKGSIKKEKIEITDAEKISLPRDFSSCACGPLEDTIKRRASTREFGEWTFTLFSSILFHPTRGIFSDFTQERAQNAVSSLIDVYVIVHSVESLTQGAYYYDTEKHILHRLKEGNFRNHSTGLCLGQPLGGDGCATLFLMADLEKVLSRYGNRGYRIAQFEAGIIAGKVYLSAYAQRLGCTGLTFYDDDVTNFFSPHAKGKSCMLVTALGKSSKRT